MIAAFQWSHALVWMWRSLGNIDLHRQEDSLQKRLQQHHDLWFVSINMKSPPLPQLKGCKWVCSYCQGYRPMQRETLCSFIGTSVRLRQCSRDTVWHIFVEENLIRFPPVVLALTFMVLSSQRSKQLPLPLMHQNELIQLLQCDHDNMNSSFPKVYM